MASSVRGLVIGAGGLVAFSELVWSGCAGSGYVLCTLSPVAAAVATRWHAGGGHIGSRDSDRKWRHPALVAPGGDMPGCSKVSRGWHRRLVIPGPTLAPVWAEVHQPCGCRAGPETNSWADQQSGACSARLPLHSATVDACKPELSASLCCLIGAQGQALSAWYPRSCCHRELFGSCFNQRRGVQVGRGYADLRR